MLKDYFMDLEMLIKTSNYQYLNSVIPKRIRPIAKIDTDSGNDLCEENIKFKNLFRHICK